MRPEPRQNRSLHARVAGTVHAVPKNLFDERIATRYDAVVTPYTSAFLAGSAVTNITLATTDTWKDRTSGERQIGVIATRDPALSHAGVLREFLQKRRTTR